MPVTPQLTAVAAVQARIAALGSRPPRVAQLEERFDALLAREIAARPAATGAAAPPTEAAAPAAPDAPGFQSAATFLTPASTATGTSTAGTTAARTSIPGTSTAGTSGTPASTAADTSTAGATAAATSSAAATASGATPGGAPAAAAGGWTRAPVLGTPRILTLPSAGVVRAAGAGSLGTGGGPIAPVAPRGGWVDRVPNQRGKDLAPYIQGVADRYGLDPALLAAVFWTESAYQADAVSSAGAVGLGQLMPGTAQTLGVDPRDPMQNMDGSARLYRYLIDKYGGSLELAISAYACGEGAVARAGGVPSDFARSYITKLLGRRDYLAGVRPTPP